IVLLILFLYPVLLLSVQGGSNVLFVILLVMSLVVWAKLKLWQVFFKERSAIYFFLSMTSILAATLLSQTYHSAFNSLYWDTPARFFFSIFIFYALKNLGLNMIPALKYGFPVGAIAGLFAALLVQYNGASEFGERASNSYLNPIHFGDLSLLLGMLSVCFVANLKRTTLLANGLQIAGLIAGLSASAMSGTRSGWVAIPIVLAFLLFISDRPDKLKRLVVALAVMAITAVAGFLLMDVVRQRVYDTAAEISAIATGGFDSSFGLRIQLWVAGFHMFIDNPIFGVGPGEFFSTMDKLYLSGAISSVPQSIYGTEVHNYFVANAAELGVLGLVSAISIFLVPLKMFVDAAKSRIEAERIAARAGICLVISFFMFCLTAEMFNIKMVASFYGLSVAVLLGSTFAARNISAKTSAIGGASCNTTN
ncbi:MAG: O-antigen ligase family protein, partial [Gallionella sp.]